MNLLCVQSVLTLFFWKHFLPCWAVEIVDDLKLVQLVFRHGDRAPIHTFKNDKNGEDLWPNGLARLTAEGIKQQFELGKFFRQRYARFLDSAQAVNQVYIRSSDQDRTLQSAAAFAAGMFPPSSEIQWDDNLGKIWRPISVHTVPFEEENLLSKQSPCPRFTRLKREIVNLPQFTSLFDKFQGEIQLVVNQSGEVLQSNSTSDSAMPLDSKAEEKHRAHVLEILSHVHDAVFCERAHGQPLPEWMKDESVFNKIDFLHGVSFHLQAGANGDTARARLAGGNLLALILKRMDESSESDSWEKDSRPARGFLHGKTETKMNGSNRTKLYVYSGHDTSVAGLLAALGLYDFNETTRVPGVPSYTATVVIELFQNDSVRISYKDDISRIESAEPTVFHIPGCGLHTNSSSVSRMCQLKDLRRARIDYIVEQSDWISECQQGDSINVSDVSVALVTVLIVIILTTIALGCYKRRSNATKEVISDSALEKKKLPDKSRDKQNGSSVTYSRLLEEQEVDDV